MYYSKYNIIVHLKNYPSYSIIHNLFHSQATLVSNDFIKRLQEAIQRDTISDMDPGDIELLKSRSFVYSDQDEEKQEIQRTYEAFSASSGGPKYFRHYEILLSYGCNLRCSYCFQKDRHDGLPMSRQRLALALKAIEELDEKATKNAFGDNDNARPALTIAGGEPLQYIPAHLELLEDIIEFSRSHDMNYDFTSNGYDLAKFIPFFQANGKCPTSIQITLDGVGTTHDRRRPHVSNGGSFSYIVDGIDAALKADILISLRVNVDRDNVDGLDLMAQLIEERGWTEKVLPYVAPVTDHSGVNGEYEGMESENVLCRKILERFQGNPALRKLFALRNFRGFEYVRACVETGKKSPPTFWRCEAMLGQKIFDPKGDIYSCFEGSGISKAQVGKYDPEFVLYPELLEQWSNLETLKSLHCADCRFAFVCAGGCPWHVIRTGKPECVPLKHQVTMAWNYFADLVLNNENSSSR